jgi:AcrR family transcriptional regulator
MPKKSVPNLPGLPITGRKTAYVMRNRAALIKSAQEVFAKRGSDATVEDIAEHAEVSVSTIYSHFETKEDLFKIAILSAQSDWSEFAFQIAQTFTDPLARLITPARLLLRLKKTHPFYAELNARNIKEVQSITPILSNGLKDHVMALIASGDLVMDKPQIRIENFSGCMVVAFQKHILDPGAKEVDADNSIEIALGMLNVSPAKAKKLAHAPLPGLKPVKV